MHGNKVPSKYTKCFSPSALLLLVKATSISPPPWSKLEQGESALEVCDGSII